MIWLLLALLLSACTTFHHPTTGATVTCQWQAEGAVALWGLPLVPIPTGHANKEYQRCKASARAAGYEAE